MPRRVREARGGAKSPPTMPQRRSPRGGVAWQGTDFVVEGAEAAAGVHYRGDLASPLNRDAVAARTAIEDFFRDIIPSPLRPRAARGPGLDDRAEADPVLGAGRA